MDHNRSERGEDVSVVSNSEHTLRDGCQIAASSSTATTFGNPPITPQSLEATLQEVAAPIPRMEGEDMFDGVADEPVSEESPTTRKRSTQYCSSAGLEDTVQEQIADIPALVEDAVVRLFGTGSATKSSADTKV